MHMWLGAHMLFLSKVMSASRLRFIYASLVAQTTTGS